MENHTPLVVDVTQCGISSAMCWCWHRRGQTTRELVTHRNTSSLVVVMHLYRCCLPVAVVMVTVASPVTSALHEAARFLEGTIMGKQYGCRFKAGTSKSYYTYLGGTRTRPEPGSPIPMHLQAICRIPANQHQGRWTKRTILIATTICFDSHPIEIGCAHALL